MPIAAAAASSHRRDSRTSASNIKQCKKQSAAADADACIAAPAADKMHDGEETCSASAARNVVSPALLLPPPTTTTTAAAQCSASEQLKVFEENKALYGYFSKLKKCRECIEERHIGQIETILQLIELNLSDNALAGDFIRNHACFISSEQIQTEIRNFFIDACEDSDLFWFEKLSEIKYCDVNDFDEEGINCPLFAAVSSNNCEMINILLEKGADINIRNRKNESAIHIAAYRGAKDAAELLIASGIDMNSVDHSGQTPAIICLAHLDEDRKQIFNILLENRINVVSSLSINDTLLSLLSYAALSNDLECFEKVKQIYSDDSHPIESYVVFKALCQIVSRQETHQEIISSLISMIGDNFDILTLLRDCITSGSLSTCTVLLGSKDFLEKALNSDIHLLSESIQAKRSDIVNYLLKIGVTLKESDDLNLLLAIACSSGNLNLVEYLLSKGAEPKLMHFLSIFESCSEDFRQITNLLLRHKSLRPHLTIKVLERALLIACESSYFMAVKYLVLKKVSVNCLDESGKTPLIKACIKGDLQIVKFLVENGASILYRSKEFNGLSAITVSCQIPTNIHILRYLLSLDVDVSLCPYIITESIFEATRTGDKEVLSLVIKWAKSLKVECTLKLQELNQSLKSIDANKQKQKPRQSQESDAHNKLETTQHNINVVPPRAPNKSARHDNQGNKNSANETMYKMLPSHINLECLVQSGKESLKQVSHSKFSDLKSEYLGCINEDSDLLQKIKAINCDIDAVPHVLMNTKGKKKILKQLQVSNICSKTFIQEYQDDSICDDDYCESRADPELTPFSDISKTVTINSLSKLKEEADSIQTYDLNSTVSDSFDNPLYPINIKSLLKASDIKQASSSSPSDNNNCSPKSHSSTTMEHLVKAIDQDIIDCSVQDMCQPSNEQLYTMKDQNHIKEESKVPIDRNLAHQIPAGPESKNEKPIKSNCTPKTSPDIHEINKRVNTPTDIFPNKSMTAINDQCDDELSEINQDINLDITMPKSQDTPLSIACAKGFEDTVSLLIGHGVNLEHRNKRGFTPLMLAAEHDHLNVIKLLIKHGAQIDQETERSRDNALGVACASGSVKCAKFLIKYLTNLHLNANNAMLVSPLDHVNSTDYTPLCFAASGGHFEICELLIESGALVDGPPQTAKIGITPLMLATMQNHVDVATYLIECGASVNTKIETNKNSILSFAISQNHSKIAKLLLERGANLEHRSKSGLTPLMEACENSNLEIVSLLVDYGADCNAVALQSPRESVLTIAASQANNLDIVIMLVKIGGANVEYRNKRGANAFWIACSHGFIDIVKFLAPIVKCDIHVNDYRGVSPIFAAFKGGHLEIVEYLSKIVSQFPREEDVLQYVNTFKLNNHNTDDEQDSKYYQELLKNMEESVKIIFHAKEKMNLKSVNCLSAFLKTFDQSEKQNHSSKPIGKRSRKKKQRCLKSENTEIISILSHKSPVTATVSNSSKFSDDIKKNNDKLDHDYLKIANNQDIQEDNTHNKPLIPYEDNRDKMEFHIGIKSESQDDRAKQNMHDPLDVFHNKKTRRKNCRKSFVTNKINPSPSPNATSPPSLEKTYPIIKKQHSIPQNVTQIPNSDNLLRYSSQSSAKKDLDNSTIKHLTKSISPFPKISQNSEPLSLKNSAKDANTNSNNKWESIRMHDDKPQKSSHTSHQFDMKNEEKDDSSSVDKSNELFGYRPKKYGRFVDLLTNQNFSIFSPHTPTNQSTSSDSSENTHNAAMKPNTEISSLFSTTKFSEENILQNIESFKYIEDLLSSPEIQNNTKNFGKQSEENSIVQHAGLSSIHTGYDQEFGVNSNEESSQTNIQFPSTNSFVDFTFKNPDTKCRDSQIPQQLPNACNCVTDFQMMQINGYIKLPSCMFSDQKHQHQCQHYQASNNNDVFNQKLSNTDGHSPGRSKYISEHLNSNKTSQKCFNPVPNYYIPSEADAHTGHLDLQNNLQNFFKQCITKSLDLPKDGLDTFANIDIRKDSNYHHIPKLESMQQSVHTSAALQPNMHSGLTNTACLDDDPLYNNNSFNRPQLRQWKQGEFPMNYLNNDDHNPYAYMDSVSNSVQSSNIFLQDPSALNIWKQNVFDNE